MWTDVVGGKLERTVPEHNYKFLTRLSRTNYWSAVPSTRQVVLVFSMPPLSRLLRLGAIAALLATRSFALPSPSVSNLEARACGQVSGYVAVHNATIADQGKWYIDIGANPAFNGAIYRTTDKSEAAHVTFDSCVVGLVSLQCTVTCHHPTPSSVTNLVF